MKINGYQSFILCLVLVIGFPLTAMATDKDRIDALEKELNQLKGTVKNLSQPRTKTDDDPPKLEIRGFGHFQYDYAGVKSNNSSGGYTTNSTNNFSNGGVDLFITSQVSRKLSFLSETVFENNEAGTSTLDVERVLLKYDYANWLQASVGRGHTAIGYWNHRFHHGTWLQTTAQRPLMYRFEDDGGILPVHFVGLEGTGNFSLSTGQLSYTGNIANGRGQTINEVQLIKDSNSGKMFSLMVAFEPNALDGFGIGANILYDSIPNNPGVFDRDIGVDEIVAGAHVYYTNDPLELIAEFQHITHKDRREYRHHGAYAQIAYKLGQFKPYYRYDVLSIREGDPYFAGQADIEDSRQHTVGVRYDWFTFAAIKVEYRYMDTTTRTSNAATAQLSFAF